MTYYADLHCHSTCSDGTLSPAELIQLAVQKGIKGLSITDHDTLDAYPAAFTLGKEANIQVIPGVEFSTTFENQSVHILGYSFDISSPKILELCQRHKSRRKERNLAILEKLKKEGIFIDIEELNPGMSASVGRPHIAKILVEKGHVPDVAAAFHQYLGDKKKCYAPGPVFTVSEAISAIRESKGLAFLAHPHMYSQGVWLRNLLDFPFDGYEGCYGMMSPEQNSPWITRAEQKKLLVSGGSDYHGAIKISANLGTSGISKEQFALFVNKLTAHSPQYGL